MPWRGQGRGPDKSVRQLIALSAYRHCNELKKKKIQLKDGLNYSVDKCLFPDIDGYNIAGL